MCRTRTRPQSNLALKRPNLPLLYCKRLDELLIAWAVDYTSDGKLALVCIPIDANILLLCARERYVDNESRVGIEDVCVWAVIFGGVRCMFIVGVSGMAVIEKIPEMCGDTGGVWGSTVEGSIEGSPVAGDVGPWAVTTAMVPGSTAAMMMSMGTWAVAMGSTAMSIVTRIKATGPTLAIAVTAPTFIVKFRLAGRSFSIIVIVGVVVVHFDVLVAALLLVHFFGFALIIAVIFRWPLRRSTAGHLKGTTGEVIPSARSEGCLRDRVTAGFWFVSVLVPRLAGLREQRALRSLLLKTSKEIMKGSRWVHVRDRRHGAWNVQN